VSATTLLVHDLYLTYIDRSSPGENKSCSQKMYYRNSFQ